MGEVWFGNEPNDHHKLSWSYKPRAMQATSCIEIVWNTMPYTTKNNTTGESNRKKPTRVQKSGVETKQKKNKGNTHIGNENLIMQRWLNAQII